MSSGKIDAAQLDDDGITWTLLGTLYLRAWESRSQQSILRDHYAAEALGKIDYDFATLKKRLRPQGNQFLVALRAKQLDDWTASFVARHPDATVLQLGVGLDSRMLRLDLPPGVRWFDVDIPKVIDLRRQLYPEREGYRMIGASVTDKDWLAEVPADRPTMIIAEGLFMYLSENENRDLFRRLTNHFDTGELVFDGIASWVSRLSKHFRWGLRGGRDVERLNPRLRCVERVPYSTHYAWIPARFYRNLYRIGHAIPALPNIFWDFRFVF